VKHGARAANCAAPPRLVFIGIYTLQQEYYSIPSRCVLYIAEILDLCTLNFNRLEIVGISICDLSMFQQFMKIGMIGSDDFSYLYQNISFYFYNITLYDTRDKLTDFVRKIKKQSLPSFVV